MTIRLMLTIVSKTLAGLLPAFLFAGSIQAQGLCDADGVAVEFVSARGGAISLRQAKTKELVGKNVRAGTIELNFNGTLRTNFRGGVLRAQGLDVDDFPDLNISSNSFERAEQNAWEVNFPRGLYQFRNKNDLQVEMIINVMGGQASHVNQGNTSTVPLAVDIDNYHEVWWGNSNSLRRLRGSMNFTYSDFENISLSGEHRATVEVCVNIRGNL